MMLQSNIMLLALAAFMLHTVVAQPVRLDISDEAKETDEQLLQLLAPQDVETESDNIETHLRWRREPIEDPDPEPKQSHDDCASHDHPDHVRHMRLRRAAGKDSSASSEEKKGKRDSADSKSSEEKPAARRRREAEKDSESDELEHEQTDSEADDIDTKKDSINSEDYAQGCEVLEVNSNELNNETTYVE